MNHQNISSYKKFTPKQMIIDIEEYFKEPSNVSGWKKCENITILPTRHDVLQNVDMLDDKVIKNFTLNENYDNELSIFINKMICNELYIDSFLYSENIKCCCNKIFSNSEEYNDHKKVCNYIPNKNFNNLHLCRCKKTFDTFEDLKDHQSTCVFSGTVVIQPFVFFIKNDDESSDSDIEIKQIKIKVRKNIPKKIRQLVWNNYFGEEFGVGKCYCCKHTKINQMEFSCGHIISVANGGQTTPENLAPICQLCNNSMGTQNMHEFMETYKL
jgi:hypothetical protein